MAAAMVKLKLDAACLPNERLTVHHNGMIFTEATDDKGQLNVTVPALAEEAVFHPCLWQWRRRCGADFGVRTELASTVSCCSGKARRALSFTPANSARITGMRAMSGPARPRDMTAAVLGDGWLHDP